MSKSRPFTRYDILICKREALICSIEYKVFDEGSRECDVTINSEEELEQALAWLDNARKSLGYYHWKLRHPALKELELFDPDPPAPPHADD